MDRAALKSRSGDKQSSRTQSYSPDTLSLTSGCSKYGQRAPKLPRRENTDFSYKDGGFKLTENDGITVALHRKKGDQHTSWSRKSSASNRSTSRPSNPSGNESVGSTKRRSPRSRSRLQLSEAKGSRDAGRHISQNSESCGARIQSQASSRHTSWHSQGSNKGNRRDYVQQKTRTDSKESATNRRHEPTRDTGLTPWRPALRHEREQKPSSTDQSHTSHRGMHTI